MPAAAADRNLLFGVLALQMDFIQKDALIRAMQAWVFDKGKPLGDILTQQQALGAEHRALLDGLVAAHLRQHGNDPHKSLAALSALQGARRDLSHIADADVQASLVQIPALPDDFATRAPSVGESTSAGVRFRILRPHAKGGLGQVFVAEDTELHREVALKEIQPRHADHPASRARFVLEAEVTGGLEHPGIAPVYGLGQYADGRPFYAMRFIRGDSLKEAIEHFHRGRAGDVSAPVTTGERAVAFRQLLARFVAVCDVIGYAHSRGVLHRDLKPENVMLGKYGETIVVDWGLAKPLGDRTESKVTDELPFQPSTSSETVAGSALGTPQFMSPEQAAGRINDIYTATDIYSLGATLYAILTGQPPFTDTDPGLVLRKVQKGDFLRPRQVRRGIPAALEASALKAMALQPEERYTTPRSLASDIEHWLADEPVSAYREPLPRRLRRWGRGHQVLVTAVAVLLLVGVAAGILVARERALTATAEAQRVNARVDTLLHASADSVSSALDDLEPLRQAAAPALRARLDDTQLSERIRVRAALGLLPDDSSLLVYLRDQLLRDNDPYEVMMIRELLAPHKAELAPALWEVAADLKTPRPRCLRALVALAKYDCQNPRWRDVAERGVAALLDDWHMHIWIEGLGPVSGWLREALANVFRNSSDADDRYASAHLFAHYGADDPPLLTDLLLDADMKQYPVLWAKVKDRPKDFVPLLRAELDKKLPTDLFDPAGERQARRQAQAAVTMLNLGYADPVWPLLRHSPDPRVRSYLIPLFEPLGANQRVLLAQFGLEKDVSVRRALLLIYGTYSDQKTVDDPAQALQHLLDFYRAAPDPGIHAGIDWLVRHRWGLHEPIDQADRELAGKPAGNRGWYVTGQGQTLTIVPGPVEFLMGSSEQEPGRDADETRHRVRIPRSFAVAAKPVTVAQFRAFLKENPSIKFTFDTATSPQETCPVVQVDWFLAAKYCRWLSEREGIAEEQMCFPALDQIKPGMKLPADYLRRTGYRLPTEAEKEFSLRAGAATSRYYGNAGELLPTYAWFQSNTRHRTMPVGQLLPNDLGLFDALGNVREWCMDRYADYPTAALTEDREGPLEVTAADKRAIRGGGFLDLEPTIRCASRKCQLPGDRFRTDGFSIARTMPGK